MTKTSTLPLLLAMATVVTACSMPARRRSEPPTAIEQLLTSQAIQQGVENMSLEIQSPDKEIYLDTTGLTGDQAFMGDVMRGWLGKLGFEVERDIEDADYSGQFGNRVARHTTKDQIFRHAGLQIRIVADFSA